jgi:catechol 2,3-dioxygenase-like lactoylglutathione lyase family enzyme
MIRLRQVALVARDLEATTAVLCDALGLSVCFRDVGVAEFGLANTLMTIGDQFLEVVSPTREGTTAGRLLDKRQAAVTGYMAIFEVDDLDRREGELRRAGVRIVWAVDLADIRGRHLHPADVGGAIVSVDQPEPPGAWRWAGPDWTAHRTNSVVTAIAGITVGAADPHALAARWHDLELDHAVTFAPSSGGGDGIDVLFLTATDRGRAGEAISIGGLTVRLV